jgi:hypothetical protein
MAAATQERRLLAVACKPLLGCWELPQVPELPRDQPPPPTRAPPGPPDAATSGEPWAMAADAAPGTGVKGASPTVPGTTARQRDVPLRRAWRCWGTALPAAPTAVTGPSRTPLRRTGAPDMLWRRTRRHRPRRARAPGAGDAMLLPGRRVGASAGQRTPPATRLPEPGAPTTAPHAGWCPRRPRQRARDHRSAWVIARRRPGPSPAVGPETGWWGSDAPGDTVHVACGGRAGSAFPWATPASKAAQQQPSR